MRALRAFVGFLREVLSENGVGSWSRVDSAVVVGARAYVIVSTGSIPERNRRTRLGAGRVMWSKSICAAGSNCCTGPAKTVKACFDSAA